MIEIMQSIRPKWCEKIFGGKKTVEVRKTRPEANPPYRVFVYETVNGGGSGLVIGEYFCKYIFPIWPRYANANIYLQKAETCLTYEQMKTYLGDNEMGCGWSITQFTLYGIPKELFIYRHYKTRGRWEYFAPLERAPQSWCYVVEVKE